MAVFQPAFLALLLLSMAPALAQGVTSAPPGGPTGQFLGPPTGNAGDFLGVWELTWDGPIDFKCPCRGTLTVTTNANGDLEGHWKMNGPAAKLTGSVGFNQNVWTGQFAQSDDADFPMRGHFRLEVRGERALTGSYQPNGTTIPFRWAGSRL